MILNKNRHLVQNMILCIGLVLLLSRPITAGSDETYENLDVLSQVMHYVDTMYVEKLDNKEMIYGAIRGILKTLDPHSMFMTPEEFKSIQEDTTGQFGGVGIEIAVERDGALIVLAPIDDTPASRAGVMPGDRIVKIDGVAAKKMDILQAMRAIKGTPGTKVVLTISRPDFEKPKDFILIRQRIQVNPVEKFMPLPGYGVVRIKTFQEKTDRFMSEALEQLKSQSGGNLKGLVLDLRNNPGGLLDQAVRVADRFLSQGLIVETKGRSKKVEQEFAHKRGTEPNYPLICLINRGSASASEIVAGALQDHNRALILGTRSYGKGSVQTMVTLKDGSGLKLTILHYFTPNHRSIQKHGIWPDIKIVQKPLEETVTTIRVRPQQESDPNKKVEQNTDENNLQDDFQLKTAMDYLKDWNQLGGIDKIKSLASQKK